MYFRNMNEFNERFKNKKYLGFGNEVNSYLIQDVNLVIRIFHYPREIMEKDYFLQYKDINIAGFSFIRDVIIINDKIVGVITPFAPGRDISRSPLASKPLNSLVDATSKLATNIRALTNAKILAVDAVQVNIIYDGSQLSCIDTNKYDRVLWEEDGIDFHSLSINNFQIMKEVYNSLYASPDMVLDSFLRKNNSIYQDYAEDYDLLTNPREVLLGIKSELESYLDMEVNTISEAVRKLHR